MKNILLIFSIFLVVACGAAKKVPTTTPSYTPNAHQNIYDSYIGANETKVYGWYQGLYTQTYNNEFIIRLFYPEKKQITSLITYKLDDKKIKHGLSKAWFDNGGKKEEGPYFNNLKHGAWKFYFYGESALSSEGDYKAGEPHGQWKNYYSSGQLHKKLEWVNGVKDGPFVEYDTLGNILAEGIYKADTIYQTTKKIAPDETHDNSGAIWTVVEEMPYLKQFEHIEDIVERKKQSDSGLLKFIYENIQYPSVARENNVEGMAVISFTVMEDGRIENIFALAGVCEGIEKECIRIVELMPQWNPGRQKGKPVRVKYNLPVRFKLN